MTTLLSDLFIRNFFLLIGLIAFILEGAAISSRCKCPKRKEIQLGEENDKAVIFSPNYPRPYCAGLSCEWKILAPSNSSLVRFSSPKIDLRPHRDHIYFYDSNGNEPDHNCTGRIKNCEFVSNGPILRIKFVTSKGVVDKYGFQATITLFDEEFQNISDEEDLEHPVEQKSSAWNFFVWAVLICVVIFIIAAALYWLCKKHKASEENRSPLLEKSSKREDSVHLSLNSPDELNELNE